MKKMKILTACFLIAFLAAGAGYAYFFGLGERELSVREQSYGHLTGEDAASALEELAEALGSAKASGYGARELGGIVSVSGRASAALGHLGQAEIGEIGPLSLVRGCEEAAMSALSGADRSMELEIFSRTLGQILSLDINPLNEFFGDSRISGILSSPELTGALNALGICDGSLSEGDFSTLVGMDTSRREALRLAEKYLGKNFGIKTSENELAYTLYAANISATVSKKGGFLMQLMFDLPEQSPVLSEEEAMAVMLKFLSRSVSEAELLRCRSIELDGLYRGEFYPVRDGILCLDEQISVGVSPGSGRVCLFDGMKYYRSRGSEASLPSKAADASEIGRAWGGEAMPCKVRLSNGTSTVCYMVEGTFVDPVSGGMLDNIRN